MPELPEVETVRSSLAPVITGHRIVRVDLRRKDLRFPFPADLSGRLTGRTITAVARRAKYLLLHLDSGDVVIIHLGMTGRILVAERHSSRGGVVGAYVYETGHLPQHDHLVLELSGGITLTYNDPRRFGYVLLSDETHLDEHALFRALGVEPLGDGLTPSGLAARAAKRKADLKAFLMDQRNIAGLGNIYVCEAIHRAGLSPRRRAGTLALKSGKPSPAAERLVPAVRAVLAEAVTAGGSTLRDYRKPDGTNGSYQEAHAVYGREGQPCPRSGCGGTIRRIVQAGRSTFYCPKCQT